MDVKNEFNYFTLLGLSKDDFIVEGRNCQTNEEVTLTWDEYKLSKVAII